MSADKNLTHNVLLFRHQDIQKYLNVNNPDLLSQLFRLECLTQEQYDQLLAFGRTPWQKVNFLLSYLLLSKCDNPLSSFIQSLKFTADYEPHRNLSAILSEVQTFQPPKTLIHTVTPSTDALRAEKEKFCMLLDVHALLPLLNRRGLLTASDYCNIIQTESKQSRVELIMSSLQKHSDGVLRLVHCLQEDTVNPSGHSELASLILDQPYVEKVQVTEVNYTNSLSRSLKRLYLERRVQVRVRWLPSLNQEILEPRLVEHNLAEGNNTKSVDYKSLFKPATDEKAIRNVLVIGEAGAGKSKFCEKLLCEWGKGAVLNDYSLVFFVPLCMKEIVSSESLDDLLLRSCPVFEGFSVKHLSLGKGCLFILDGWDELSNELHQDKSVLRDIISFRCLPFASVIITSRAVASNDVRRMFTIDRCVTLQGFAKADIEKYIKLYIEPAAPLIQQLEANLIFENVCTNPLNCAIVCHLWKITGGCIPFSITELYTRIIFNVVHHEIERRAPQDMNLLTQLETNPAHLWSLEPMLKLCNLAFTGLKEGQTTFTRSDLENVFASTSRDLPLFHQSLGLLQSTLSYTPEGHCSLLFFFTHQTFQEYLAARYISNLDELRQVAVSREFSTHPSFQRVWQFYFGVSQQDIPRGVISKCLQSNDAKPGYKLHLCRCAYEAGSEVVDNLVAANIKGKFGPYECNLSAYDCLAIAQTISHTTVPLKIMLKYSHCGDKGMMEIIGTIIHVSNQRKLNVEKLHLPCADITADSFKHFSKALPVFKSLKELDLTSNKIGPLALANILESGSSLEKISLKNVGITGSDDDISTVLKSLQCHKQLTELVLSGNYLGISGVEQLATCLENLQDLKVLRVRGVLEGSPLDEIAMAALLKSIALYCPNLAYLDISCNSLSSAAARALGKALAILKSPHNVWVNQVNFTDESMHEFTDCLSSLKKSSLQSSHIISHLELLDNELHAEGIYHLVEVIITGSLPVSRLYLGGNPLGPEGASQIARMLETKDCPIHSLSLSRCNLGTEGAIILLHALSSNTSLEDITLTENRMGEADKAKVCTFIYQLLKSSHTFKCEPVTSDLKWFCNFLKCNNHLEYLRISNNYFTGDGIEILLAFLSVCRSLKLLCSLNCHITSHDLRHKGLQSFERDQLPALFKHEKLQKWRLEDNEIEEDAVSVFSKLVRSACPQLKHIFLRGNPIYHSQEAQGFKLEDTFKWKVCEIKIL